METIVTIDCLATTAATNDSVPTEKIMRLIPAILLALFTSTAVAETSVLHCGRMVDVNRGELLADRYITVDGQRIVNVSD